MPELTVDELFFFDGKRPALPLYEALRERILSEIPQVRIEVKKTQISFFCRRMFAAASFAPVRRAAERPDPFLTVTFGLPAPLKSSRIAAAEAAPRRWTHHVLIGTAEEIDEELMSWLREAAAFSALKR